MDHATPNATSPHDHRKFLERPPLNAADQAEAAAALATLQSFVARTGGMDAEAIPMPPPKAPLAAEDFAVELDSAASVLERVGLRVEMARAWLQQARPTTAEIDLALVDLAHDIGAARDLVTTQAEVLHSLAAVA